MRIHLGHHFYGAGNLGDDFMLAGFLVAAQALAPGSKFTCSVPFALEPLRRRFPAIEWLPYEPSLRERAIAECDVWLGLGGSPFQNSLSRWFLDHLVTDAAYCARGQKPMFYLGIGIQTVDELRDPDTQNLCAQAAAIWTRDEPSAQRLIGLPEPPARVTPAADLAHLFFRATPPPPALAGRATLVVNFDYAAWPAQPAFLRAMESLPAGERAWLAQESRLLPGAERALHTALTPAERLRWPLVAPEQSGAPLADVLAAWPSGEWLVTARHHAALAGAWARSKVVVVSTNEKLRAVARELGCPSVPPEADTAQVAQALASASPGIPGSRQAEQVYAACGDFFRSTVALMS